MDNLTIAQLSQFSGIKAHTIRIWEQRYNAFTPERSEGNVRYYSSLQLRRLLNIVSLLEADYKISKICKLSDAELEALIKKLYLDETSNKGEVYISQLITVGTQFNAEEFSKILAHCFNIYGVLSAYKNIVYPLINRVGLMWTANLLPPAQEHFMTNLIRQKIFASIDLLPSNNNYKETWVLLLPEDEFHEIGLLFSYYLLKINNVNVVYLGSNVPVNTLNVSLNELNPDNVLMFLVHNNHVSKPQNYLESINSKKIKGKIYISGLTKMIKQLKLKDNAVWLETFECFEELLERVGNND